MTDVLESDLHRDVADGKRDDLDAYLAIAQELVFVARRRA